MTWREAVYMVLDELKLMSDDSNFNEDHIIFLLSKYRSFILKQTYYKTKQIMPESNYQTICVDLNLLSDCATGDMLVSTTSVPTTMSIGTSRIYADNYYYGDIAFISKERMRFVGNNKWLKNIIYGCIGPDKHLYLKSSTSKDRFFRKKKICSYH